MTSVYDASRSRGIAQQFLDTLGIGADDVDRLPDAPMGELLTASKRLFDEVPVRTPGTLAYAPIVDGELVPDYPVAIARAGGTHPVPLIIGTNKHEAALFRFMKSPLMPITPTAIKSMFDGIASEQPSLQLPSEADLMQAYPGRGKTPGMGVARDIGFRMPTIWFAEGHAAVAPVFTYRFDWATPMLKLLRLGAAHATELPYVWGNLVAGSKDPTFKLGGLKAGTALSERIRTRWVNFAATGEPTGPAGSRVGGPTATTIAPPCCSTRATWWSRIPTGRCERPGATTCSASAEPTVTFARLGAIGRVVPWKPSSMDMSTPRSSSGLLPEAHSGRCGWTSSGPSGRRCPTR